MSDVTEMYGTEPRIIGGRYELGAGIGYGGMAEVYRGRDIRLGRDVAVKVLRSDLARDPNFLKRFQREAQSAAGLNHPAIVSTYDTGEDVINGVHLPYIVMEFIEGRTLREVLQQEGPFPERRAMEITSDICAALDYSHRLGIIHRDIKPANVMLSPDGSIKVMDFGIAKANNATSSTMTATQAVIGTAQYLSPEQARGAKVDARSDVYSTGVLIYELITGEPPFRGDNPVAVAYQHVRELPDPPSRRNPQLSATVDAVTLKALEKEPDDRYATAGEMRDDLERAIAGRRVFAQLPSPRPAAGGGASAAATQLAPGGYGDDYRGGGGARYGDTGYRDTGYRDTGYDDQTGPYPSGSYGGGGDYDDQHTRIGGYGGRYDDEFDRAGAPGASDRYGPGGGPAAPEPRRGSNAWKWVLAGLAVVLTFVVVSLVATSLFSNKGGGGDGATGATQATIPQGLLLQSREVVQNQLSDLGFTNITVDRVKTADAPTDVTEPVTKIDPVEGSKIDKTAKITLTVAVPPDSVEVPDVTGMSRNDAVRLLTEAGFQPDPEDFIGQATQKAGTVEKTDPAGGQPWPKGSSVKVYVVSSKVNVGDYVGRDVSIAQSELTSLGLKYTISERAIADQPAGTVLDQNPRNATVNRGDTITLVVAAQAAPTETPSPTVTPSTKPPTSGPPTETPTSPAGGTGAPTTAATGG
ncbi:Stk1 family PASTA domain-containing Ser/Thr kinase [Pseudofrankia sp. BMG5.37]|uniref:Stk1 family PASTA domain-containing Ser/Thr kinase n=1 Tax=Pseudofrankia sp. BMG5.37 TaxID=3050035 RepID=UPI0028959F50|nr:Stk1 family PASTA domain-containing Ser/Thr kinase [Pseudofrankia sp. BMG5.37]MDT3445521.1 Stk1 family PASTA domain-containing Ser/Thr kinase [Pseudofrankia sp. BMG5.37]